MKTVGLITEYNPFHNGHLHHLRESICHTGADVAVAMMSGHFLQRGEPALVDKWCRAQMALSAGVDIVVELPLPWASSSAPTFAAGGVQALNALGAIDHLCFGSEVGKLEPLQLYADTLYEQQDVIEGQTAQLLKQGLTYPQARAQLVAELLSGKCDLAALDSPNNILGIEYLTALRQTQSNIQPLTIARMGADYHDRTVTPGRIASATGIRQCLQGGHPVAEFMPEQAFDLLRNEFDLGHSYSSERYFNQLLAQIFRQTIALRDYWLVENGIENRLLAVADSAENLDSLIAGIKSRQLTRTRIQRLLVAIFLGIKRSDCAELFASGPRYLHLLAASKKGQEFLATSRKQRELPLVQNFSRIYATLKRFYGSDSREYRQALKQLDLELRATRSYSLLLSKYNQGQRNRDFYQPLLRLDS